MENNNNQSFLQFSDQLRHQTSNLANLSLNDSIWSSSYGTKRTGERRNFDIRVGGDLNSSSGLNLNGSDFDGSKGVVHSSVFNNGGWSSFKSSGSDINGFVNNGWNNNNNNNNHSFKPKASLDFNGFVNDGWKLGTGVGPVLGGVRQKNIGINGGFNKGINSNKSLNHNIYNDIGLRSHKKNGKEDEHGVKGGKKNSNKKNSNNNGESNNDSKDGKNAADKRFKSLPPSESLPRNETVGGYIFVCNNDTMQENLKRQLFGLPPRYRDSVRAITPGLPLFLYNYSTHQLHGIFEAASFGGSNIDPTAWEDKKCPGESRFPAQVQVVTRKICEPLEEDSFRPILYHYDGPKFRLELNVPEALSLLDIFAEQDS
ncbi:Development/cell death domain containing protein [Parasponia andersonii]|uniref:Development/cell death domain containing protein n=1 Tax=Parasponia andersonii TaxID=3476 RepID=A0A2P5ACF2_PARAD|nr:Development/cell death domain containing protein [Parasponia andersonii]